MNNQEVHLKTRRSLVLTYKTILNIQETNQYFTNLSKEDWFDFKKIDINYGWVKKQTASCICDEEIILDGNEYQSKSLELTKYFLDKGAKWEFFPSLTYGCGATCIPGTHNYVVA